MPSTTPIGTADLTWPSLVPLPANIARANQDVAGVTDVVIRSRLPGPQPLRSTGRDGNRLSEERCGAPISPSATCGTDRKHAHRTEHECRRWGTR